jgi:hypothetical protein
MMRARDGIKSNVAVGDTFGMSASKRTIGVSTGGGDCPGLNAVIRAVVRTARLEYGWRVIGVTNGFNGLIWPEQSEELTTESIRGILPRGGTILGTTNCRPSWPWRFRQDGLPVRRRDYVRAARAVGITFGDHP